MRMFSSAISCSCSRMILTDGVVFTMHAMIGKRLNEINRGSTAGVVLSALLVLAVLLASPAAAQLRIEITKGATGAIPIAVVPFAWQGEGEAPGDIAALVKMGRASRGVSEAAN